MNSSRQFSLASAMADLTLLSCLLFLLQLPPVGVAFLIFISVVCRVVTEPRWFVAVALATGIAIAACHNQYFFHHTGDGSEIDARINVAFFLTMATYFLFAIVYFAQHYMDRFLKYVGDGLRQRDR